MTTNDSVPAPASPASAETSAPTCLDCGHAWEHHEDENNPQLTSCCARVGVGFMGDDSTYEVCGCEEYRGPRPVPASPARETPTNAQQEPGYPGAGTVAMSLRYPMMTAHRASARCPVEAPHQTAECGEFAPLSASAGESETFKAQHAARLNALGLTDDFLGERVRDAWVRWAERQPNPKPHWLVPWSELGEVDRDADREIGRAVAIWTLAYAAGHGEPAASSGSSTTGGVEELVRLARAWTNLVGGDWEGATRLLRKDGYSRPFGAFVRACSPERILALASRLTELAAQLRVAREATSNRVLTAVVGALDAAGFPGVADVNASDEAEFIEAVADFCGGCLLDAKADLAALRRQQEGDTRDAERWRYVRANSQWIRRDDGDGERTYIEVRVPDGSDLSCAPMIDRAVDAARPSPPTPTPVEGADR